MKLTCIDRAMLSEWRRKVRFEDEARRNERDPGLATGPRVYYRHVTVFWARRAAKGEQWRTDRASHNGGQ